jgi:hypothetical protein
MKRLILCLFLLCLLLSVSAADKTYNISGFIGTSTVSAASNVQVELINKQTGEVIQTDETNFFGKYKFKNVAPGAYLVRVESVTKLATVKDKNVRLDIDLSAKGGIMDYTKSAQAVQNMAGTATSPGPSDPALMQMIAGEYYSYSGSTERKVMFCPDGIFFDSSESSYSAYSSDSLGNQTGYVGAANQNNGSGGWAIQGNNQSGVITLKYKGGKQVQVKYSSTGEKGCYLFDGITFCLSGPPRCGQ